MSGQNSTLGWIPNLKLKSWTESSGGRPQPYTRENFW